MGTVRRVREVWITGAGVVSATGIGVGCLESMLRQGSTAINGDVCADISCAKAPDPSDSGANLKRADRSARMFVTAAREAWKSAGLSPGVCKEVNVGLIEGSSAGPMADLLTAHRKIAQGTGGELRPSFLLRFMTGGGGAIFAQENELDGPVLHVSAGSTSAMCAIGEGFQKIEDARLDIAIVGGAECPLHPDIMKIFSAAKILAEDDRCRPFDTLRSGTILGEGAGVFVLEEASHARRRNAQPLGIVAGYGVAVENHSMISPDPRGIGVSLATRKALKNDGTGFDGWIKAHGTGTRANDSAECHGLADVFGRRLTDLPITSLKSTLGHCLGASGSVEAVAVLLALRGGFVPGTHGLEERDPDLPECSVVQDVMDYEAHEVLMLSEGFGGKCAALVLQKT